MVLRLVRLLVFLVLLLSLQLGHLGRLLLLQLHLHYQLRLGAEFPLLNLSPWVCQALAAFSVHAQRQGHFSGGG
jgi:hypothetical protein